jgi:Collagen triple helix repeat (20 copies)
MGQRGPAGANGLNGQPGPRGYHGPQGPQGNFGVQGPQGERGPAGDVDSLIVLARVDDVDLTAEAEWDLYTVPANRQLLVTHAIIRTRGVSGVKQGPSVTVAGIVGKDLAFGAAGQGVVLQRGTTVFDLYEAGKSVKLSCDAAGKADALLVSVDIIGYLL